LNKTKKRISRENTMKWLLLFLFCLVVITTTGAQDNQTTGPDIDPSLNSVQNTFLNNQADALLNQAGEVLSEVPPAWPEPDARRSALLLLDGVLHDVYAPYRPPVQRFLKTRIHTAAGEIEQTRLTTGARIWKIYNHTFIVRTASVTIAFDLVGRRSFGADGFSINEEDMLRLVNQCDVLFISHYHGDHAEEWVAQQFVDAGKPVVAPAEVWRDKAIYAQITHLKREPHAKQILPVQNGNQQLEVVIYPGHQGSNIPNNVALVFTPEGLSFSHMGDQSNDADFSWIDTVAQHFNVDVLLPNCWTTDIVRVARGFDPALIITGHENEMGHTIDHREPYWLTYQRRTASERFGGDPNVGYDTPLIPMAWGESYLYKRDNFSSR
jgi:L-ascorbate metabolism protein UlaG (beta-lactamase superfamily)